MATRHFKLTYFDGRGLAETSRYLLALGGVEFEDVRLPIVFRSPEEGGPLRPEFDALKASGALPFGQVPILEVDGAVIAQSKAIERFLAREFSLAGANSLETARIDSLSEGIADLRLEYSKANWWSKPEEKDAKLAEFFGTIAPKHLALLEKNFPAEGPINLADVQFAAVVEAATEEKLPLDAYPKLKARVQQFREHPAITKYLSTRKQTPF